MRVFLDANILFSASELQSRTFATLAALLQLNHEAVTSPYAWGETQRNLGRKRPHLLDGFKALRDMVTIVDAWETPVGVECVAKDAPILAGAIGAKCTHLWTGDKAHFGMFYGKRICGVTVVSGIQLAALLARS